ncbi:carbohydrate ABC transporter permease [Treponema sp. OttesenSCG-928-L16]|nr:carbohydrate ABC transporter permease [Treponema sp. OttesenSCG-928-L16]
MKTARNRFLYEIKERLWKYGLHLFFILFSFLIIYPFWMVFVDSINDRISLGLRLLPKKFSLEAYKIVLTQQTTYTAFLNSILRVAVGMTMATVVTFGAAYALSKKRIPFNRVMTMYVIIPMFFSGGLIPFYLLMNSIGLMDSRWVLILPPVFSGFNILVTRNFIFSIPIELEESALLDGANEMMIAFRIFLPLCLPIIATIALWSAVAHWNEYFHAMIFIRTPAKQVLQVILRNVLIQAQLSDMFDDTAMMIDVTERSIRSALLFISTLPILVVYPFAQKYFIKGLTAGAVKG